MEQQQFVYETKCRRCGTITDWFFSWSDHIQWLDFAKAMDDMIQSPRTYKCNKCGKSTVQDVVSFTDPPK